MLKPFFRSHHRILIALLPVLFLALGSLTSAQTPTTVIVNSLEDIVAGDTFCTLREAVNVVNTQVASADCPADLPIDGIDLRRLQGSIDLLAPLPPLAAAVEIRGPGGRAILVCCGSKE
jgi:CSLREA domain-containing protein